jgi:ketosteroid isomerase-like protein
MKKGVLTFLLLWPILLMAQSKKEVSVDFLQSFADAFNAHDVKAIMSLMTEDCVFEASAGPDIDGEKFTGQEQVKQAFENVFATFPDANWGSSKHFVSGDRGFSEWIFTGTKIDGTRVEVTGCDLFTFKNGKIAIKNSYRKNRVPTK